MSFEDDDDRESQKQYYLQTVEIKDGNAMIDGRNFFDHPTKNDLKTCCNIRKTATRQGNDYSMGCLLGSPYFKKYFKLIARDLSKKQKLEADPKAIQQINFTGNLDEAENLQKNSFFHYWRSKINSFSFFKRNS